VTTVTFTRYFALGDSMSIDRYPARDANEATGSVGRGPAQLFVELPLGAASLLYRNEPVYWPEFQGRDLVSRYPKIGFANLASDGATIGDVFGEQLPEIEESEEPVLVTLTIGGNDLLSAYAGKPSKDVMRRAVGDIAEGQRVLVERLRQMLPRALIVTTTVYDPTDGTGKLPGVLPGVGKLPLEYLDMYNDSVREVASGDPSLVLADVHRHFLGHGVSVKPKDRWYWRHSLIEPSAEGANEIRRVWLDAIDSR
jgi:lysophospholipase L1-like esterase